MIMKLLPLGSYQANCYILESAGEIAVIDPGDEGEKVLAQLEGKEPKYILLTHGHFDHTGAVAMLRDKFPSVMVGIHPGDFENADPEFFPIARQLTEVYPLAGGQSFTLGDTEIQVIHTPGHSKGSVCFLVKDCLFTGDTLFYCNMGRTDLTGGSYPELLASLKKLADLSGNYQVFPGHDRHSSLDFERKNNPYMREALGK
ncbi:MAG: MBL fold metallo-hydrolase [Eubacteriales bacterium]